MSRTVRYLDVIQHANPCREDWDEMEGDAWVRHCPKCAQNVYNLSAMTAGEAERLLREREGQVCTKLFRRPDGSVLTQRCPSSMRRAWGRALRLAAAVGVVSAPAFGHDGCPRGRSKIKREDRAQGAAPLRGRVTEPSGSVIPGAVVTSRSNGRPPAATTTNDRGEFSLEGLPDGMCELVVDYPGFVTYRRPTVKIVPGRTTVVDVVLEIGALLGDVVYVDRPAAPVRAVGQLFRWIGKPF